MVTLATITIREPPEATGEEADDEEIEAPKIYEPVSSHTTIL